MTHWYRCLGLCIVCFSWGLPVFAETHGADPAVPQLSDEETLIAIKEALVAEAQAAESQVVNTAWLDEQGRLHESTLVQSGVRVRGIQVKSYLDAMNEPKIEVALDDKLAALPACFTQDDQLTRTVVTQSEVEPSGGGSALSGVLETVARRTLATLRRDLRRTPEWRLLEAAPAVDPYTKLLAGVVEVQPQYTLQLAVEEAEMPLNHVPQTIPDSDAVSVFFKGNPSKFPEQWMTVKAVLTSTHRADAIWSATAPIRIPVRDVQLGQVRLPKAVEEALVQTVSDWTAQLSAYAQCEPMHFYLVNGTARELTISGGTNSGVRPGDRLLVLDETRVPQRILEPGTLAQLSLVQVTQVDVDTAVVVRTAGAAIGDLEHKVAIPF